MGFTFYLGASTQEIVREGNGLSVNLKSGEKIAADMVLVSAGVRPVIDLAKQARLVIDKAVQVNDQMETSIADIYAAGDVVEHKGVFYGIWPASMEQGRIAGANMAGGSEVYTGTLPANKLKVVGIDLVAAGDIDADNKLEAVVHENPGKVCTASLLLTKAGLPAQFCSETRAEAMLSWMPLRPKKMFPPAGISLQKLILIFQSSDRHTRFDRTSAVQQGRCFLFRGI